MVRFLHTSDWQIGMKGGGLGEAGPIVREARIESVRNVLRLAQANAVDFVLLCGDAFEHNMVSQEEVKKAISIFNEYEKVPIYLLPGNHDALGAGCIYNREIFKRVSHLTILDTTNPVKVADVTLHPCPVVSRITPHDLTEKIGSVHKVAGIHIGVAHGSLVGKFPVSNWEDIDLPIDPSCIERTGVEYLALGHWHSQRIFEDDAGTGRIAYSGTHEQTDYSEDNAGRCLLVAIDKKGDAPQIESVETGQLRWVSKEFKMEDSRSLGELKDYLDSIRGIDMVRLVLNGELPLEYRQELDNLLDFQTTMHKNIRIDSESLNITVPFQSETPVDTGDLTLNRTETKLRQLLANETNPRRGRVILDALTQLQAFAKEAEA